MSIFPGVQPYTEDELTPITLYGRTYPVKDDLVTIPTKNGDAIVRLVKEGKRKDWFYRIEYKGGNFVQVDLGRMLNALHHIIKEEDVNA